MLHQQRLRRACKHLPSIQFSDPRPAGSQPTLCCKKSLLTPSIKATLIFCLKQPTTWTAFMVLITSGPTRGKVTAESKVTVSALSACQLPYIYTPSGSGDSFSSVRFGSYFQRTRGGFGYQKPGTMATTAHLI